MDQARIFLDSEGDNYFRRNQSAMEAFDPATDFPLRLLDLYQLKPKTVLEIGASTGFRLAEIQRKHGSRAVGVDPSRSAIEHGRTVYPSVEFHHGVISDVPVRETFDLVIVNYVLHWVDRSRLLVSVAEVDRLVNDNAFLLLGDFYPDQQSKVRYHHLPGMPVYTYKQQYADLFVASGLYRVIAQMSIGHPNELSPCADENSRAGFWLLHKSLEGHYVEKRFPGDHA